MKIKVEWGAPIEDILDFFGEAFYEKAARSFGISKNVYAKMTKKEQRDYVRDMFRKKRIEADNVGLPEEIEVPKKLAMASEGVILNWLYDTYGYDVRGWEQITELTRYDVRKAIELGIVQFITDPNMGSGTVAKIGEYWFYIGGNDALELSPDEYNLHTTIEEKKNRVYEALSDMEEEMETEYKYYVSYIQEGLKELTAENYQKLRKAFIYYVEDDLECCELLSVYWKLTGFCGLTDDEIEALGFGHIIDAVKETEK